MYLPGRPASQRPPPWRHGDAQVHERTAFRGRAEHAARVLDGLVDASLLLEGPDAAALLAHRGQALDALQFLLHEAQGERDEDRLVYLDVQGYRLFRMKELQAMAALAAEKARTLGSFTLGSLNPRERRWVHLTIAKEPGLTTESEGTGAIKALTVKRA